MKIPNPGVYVFIVAGHIWRLLR